MALHYCRGFFSLCKLTRRTMSRMGRANKNVAMVCSSEFWATYLHNDKGDMPPEEPPGGQRCSIRIRLRVE